MDEFDTESRKFEVIALSGEDIVDWIYENEQDQTRVVASGVRLPDYMGGRMPSLLNSHDGGQVIGSVNDVWLDGDALMAEIEFSSTPEADSVFENWKLGRGTGISVGIQPTKRAWHRETVGDRIITTREISESVLLEISATPIPRDHGAGAVKRLSADSGGVDTDFEKIYINANTKFSHEESQMPDQQDHAAHSATYAQPTVSRAGSLRPPSSATVPLGSSATALATDVVEQLSGHFENQQQQMAQVVSETVAQFMTAHAEQRQRQERAQFEQEKSAGISLVEAELNKASGSASPRHIKALENLARRVQNSDVSVPVSAELSNLQQAENAHRELIANDGRRAVAESFQGESHAKVASDWLRSSPSDRKTGHFSEIFETARQAFPNMNFAVDGAALPIPLGAFREKFAADQAVIDGGGARHVRRDDLMPAYRAQMPLPESLGVTQISTDQEIRIPRFGATTFASTHKPAYVGETGAAVIGDASLSYTSVGFERISSGFDITAQVRNAAGGQLVEAIYMAEMNRAINNLESHSMLNGNGVSPNPTGLLSVSGVQGFNFGSGASGAQMNYRKLCDFYSLLDNREMSGDDSGSVVLVDRSLAPYLKTTAALLGVSGADATGATGTITNGTALMSEDGMMLGGKQCVLTSHLLSNGMAADGTTAISGKRIVYGNWSRLILARLPIMILTDDLTSGARTGVDQVTMSMWMGVGVTSPDSFASAEDLTI